MAKKPLKRHEFPLGARRQFFDYMHHLVLAQGDPSVATMAAAVGYSSQAVYKALTAERMPSRAIVGILARHLGGDAAAEQAAELWNRGVAEERSEAHKATSSTASASRLPRTTTAHQSIPFFFTPADGTDGHSHTAADLAATVRRMLDNHENILWADPAENGQVRDPRAPRLTERELMVLLMYVGMTEHGDMPASIVAASLQISEDTVRTHLSNVRRKFHDMGWNVGSKHELADAAIQSGLVRVTIDSDGIKRFYTAMSGTRSLPESP